MTPDALFGWFTTAPCGAFAVSLDQTVVFWNADARRVLGYPAGRVVGLKCYEVMSGVDDSGLTADCRDGCVFVHQARLGITPVPMDLMMRCASGARKLLKVHPVVVWGTSDGNPVVLYLFGDADEVGASGGLRWTSGRGAPGDPLTAHEVEVLHYLALG